MAESKKSALWFAGATLLVLWCVWWASEPTTVAQSQGNHYPMGLYLNECADKTAADPITVDDCNVVRFNGAATPVQTINNCTEAQRGRVLHIVCDGDATVFDDGGGNLNLARDFTCSANDTLTISCTKNAADAYEWLEIGRGAHIYAADTSTTAGSIAVYDDATGQVLGESGCSASDAGSLACSAGSFGLISVVDNAATALGVKIEGDATSGSDQYLSLFSGETGGTGFAMNYTQFVDSLEAYSGMTGTSLRNASPGAWLPAGTANRVFIINTALDLELDNCVSVGGSGGPTWCSGTTDEIGNACSPNGSIYSDTNGDTTGGACGGTCYVMFCKAGTWTGGL